MKEERHVACPEHGRLLERVKSLQNEVTTLKKEVKGLEETIHRINLSQVEDRQLVKSLYETLGEIKEAIKELTNKLELMKQKPAESDLFKDTMLKLALDVFRFAIAGGIVAGIMKFGFKI